MIMTADGAVMDVIQEGHGPDLVLLHSLLTDRTVFDGIVPALAGRRRLTLPNLPGFGASAPAGPRIEDYADRIAALLDALALPAATDVVAMSFGGFVGIALARVTARASAASCWWTPPPRFPSRRRSRCGAWPSGRCATA